MVRIEVLNQNEGDAVVGRQSGQKFAARIQATRRCANSDDWEVGGSRRWPP
jgi:hypothetical protein